MRSTNQLGVIKYVDDVVVNLSPVGASVWGRLILPCGGNEDEGATVVGFGKIDMSSFRIEPGVNASYWDFYSSRLTKQELDRQYESLALILMQQRIIEEQIEAACVPSTIGGFSEQSVDSYFNNLQAFESTHSYKDYLLPSVFYHHLLQASEAVASVVYELRKSIKRIKAELAHQHRAIFCGMSWCKRAWFLMHGSHPPKSETYSLCTSSGCA